MKQIPILFTTVVLLLCIRAFSVDGTAVSVSFRTGLNQNYACCHKVSVVPECNPAEPGWGWGWYYPRGQIVKFTIVNNKPTGCDTIYKGLRDGLAQNPAISFDGSRVAFFRWGCFIGKSPSSGIDTLLGQNLPAHISLINIDGTGLTDLVTLPASPAFESSLDWSADGWIYYTRPRANTAWYWQRESKEIWRIKAQNPMQHEPVGTYTAFDPADTFFHCATWSISAAASYSMFSRSDSFVTVGQLFPSFNGDYARNAAFSMHGSDGTVSPGGNLVAGFKDSVQTRVFLHTWNHFSGLPSAVPLSSCTPQDLQWWRNQAGGPYSNNGGGGWIRPRFATNSEKWLCLQVGWYGSPYLMWSGSNQQMVDFSDKWAIQTSENAYNGDQFDETSVRYGNCSGDFWVKPPSGISGKYENFSGEWIPVFQPSRLMLSPDSVCLKPGDSLRIFAQAFDSTDRPVSIPPAMTWTISGTQSIEPLNQSCLFRAGATEGGPYLLIVKASGFVSDTVRILVSPSPGMNLDRTGWTASASGGYYVAYANVFDGDVATYWNTQTPQKLGQWFMIDMQKQHAGVCRALLLGQQNSDYPRSYSAFVSTDGVSWGTAVAMGNATSNTTDIRFSSQTCRFVKIVITADANPYWSICEANIYTNESKDFPSFSPLPRFAKQAIIRQDAATLMVSINSLEPHQIMLVSCKGDIVFRQQGHGITAYRLPTSSYASGVYIVKTLIGNGSFSKTVSIGQ